MMVMSVFLAVFAKCFRATTVRMVSSITFFARESKATMNVDKIIFIRWEFVIAPDAHRVCREHRRVDCSSFSTG